MRNNERGHPFSKVLRVESCATSYRSLHLRRILKFGKFPPGPPKWRKISSHDLCDEKRKLLSFFTSIQLHRDTRERRLSVCFTLPRGFDIYGSPWKIATFIIGASTDPERFTLGFFSDIFLPGLISRLGGKKLPLFLLPRRKRNFGENYFDVISDKGEFEQAESVYSAS